MGGELPLPSLSISGFRGFPSLSIPQLGRVTLLTGRNGVGKTTVLDAIRIYAATTYDTPFALAALLEERLGEQDEWRDDLDEKGDKVLIADYNSLFHGRLLTPDQPISIGPESDENNVKLEVYQEGTLPKEQEEKIILSLSHIEDTDIPPLLVTFKNRPKYILPWMSSESNMRLLNRYFSRMVDDNSEESPEKLNCTYIGPNLPSNEALVEFIDKVALTEEDYRPKEALELILDYKIYGIAVVGRDKKSRPRVMVKLSKQEPRVPLKRLGDGVMRLFGIAAALVKSRNGLLLIDEVENGIHYSVHEKLWTMILKAAGEHNIQVVATTHSWDAVMGFANAAENLEMEEASVVVRIERHGKQFQAVKYTGDRIKTISEYDIEVR